MTQPKLINHKTNDNARRFLELPENVYSERLFLHTLYSWGAQPKEFIYTVLESWIMFHYQNYEFSINNQYGEYWFFVRDPECPEEILEKVAIHFATLLK